MIAPDLSIETGVCDCDWSGPCRLCKRHEAHSKATAAGFLVMTREELKARLERVRSACALTGEQAAQDIEALPGGAVGVRQAIDALDVEYL
jgi:hypothetical protein